MLLQEKVKLLENIDENGGSSPSVSKGKVQLFNRGIQTKKTKQKERNIQTDVIIATQSSMPNAPAGGLLSTQSSMIKPPAMFSQKPRISSAAHTTTTVGLSGQHLNRDPSQGFSSTLMNSQGELHLIDYNAAINVGSASNISEYERAIKSAAQKFRHQLPGSDAIEEEAENITRVGGGNLQGGMFKRNSHIDEDL